MSVKELIELLEKYDENYEVLGSVYIEDTEYVLEIDTVENYIDRVFILLEDAN